jgi:hypothetical protein
VGAAGREGTLGRWCLERRQRAPGDSGQPVDRLGDVGAGGGQRGGVGVQRVVVQQGGGADLDDLPGVHDDRAVADGGRQVQIVGDEQHRQPGPAAQIIEDRYHLGLGDGVERGGRLVGQQQAGPGQQRGGDHHPLQHPARHLVRVLPQLPGRVLDADLAERLGCPIPGLRRAYPLAGAQRLGHEVTDATNRVDVCPRILEDHRHLGAVGAQARAGEPANLGAGEPDRAVNLGPVRQQAADRPGGHGLPGPGLTHQADGFARCDRERDVPEHSVPDAVYLQQHAQRRHLQQRRPGHGRGRRAASGCLAVHQRAAVTRVRPGSNNRSPSTLTAITTATMHAPADSAGSG